MSGYFKNQILEKALIWAWVTNQAGALFRSCTVNIFYKKTVIVVKLQYSYGGTLFVI